MIYHYTSIETLSLILESNKIRFNNLNAVDDILEGSLFQKRNLGQFIFVSCWTKNPEENIALWKMYTNGKGIRIGLPDNPWRKITFDKTEWAKYGFEIRSKIPEIFTSPFAPKGYFY